MIREVNSVTVQIEDRELLVWLRVTNRTTRVRIKVKAGPIVFLIYPPNVSVDFALDFLQKNSLWLKKTLNKTRTVQPFLVEHLKKFPWFTIDDRIVTIEFIEGNRSECKLNLAEEKASIVLPISSPEVSLHRVVRRIAVTGLNLAVSRLSQRCGVEVEKISIRNQSSRWGSCSNTGTLSLNWRLILLPPNLHDHVILHELAHRRHMNHSCKFWNQLADWDTEWEFHDREITKRWSSIMDLAR